MTLERLKEIITTIQDHSPEPMAPSLFSLLVNDMKQSFGEDRIEKEKLLRSYYSDVCMQVSQDWLAYALQQNSEWWEKMERECYDPILQQINEINFEDEAHYF